MTEKKNLKRRVRARMEKTGERYATARAHVVRPEPARPEPRVSDETLVARTGRRWAEWLALLDAWGAAGRKHGEIARHLREEHGVASWWAQTVAVGYEEARGLRARHERPDGWSVGASKTVAVPVERLFEAFVDAKERERWLPGAPLRLRTAQPGRSARFDWENGTTRVTVGFTGKGEAKSTVAVEHERLPAPDEAERRKAYWRERLAALKRLLEG